MILYLLFLHSLVRWLLLASLLISIVIAARGVGRHLHFTSSANLIRHWTATFSHIQLMIGIILYSQSPWVKAFQREKLSASPEALYFGLIHIGGMLTAIILLTIGSAKAKRETMDRKKYTIMLNWFLAALVIIIVMIPWPLSPLASRPWVRSF